MDTYHKIQTVYLRDPANKNRTLLRGQFAWPEFGYLANNEWLWTEKVDGTNIRVDWDTEAVLFGGRSAKSLIPSRVVNKLLETFPPMTFRLLYPEVSMTLYGEGYGQDIQAAGKHYAPDAVGFILFDVKIGGVFLERPNVEDIAAKLGVPVVPMVGIGTLADAISYVETGFPSRVAADEMTAEGLVMRPTVELLTRTGNRIITKVKFKDFPRP